MRAIVIDGPGNAALRQISDPRPGPGELVVRVDSCGICGTDLHVLDGDFAPTRYPIVPGHEFCGEVVAVRAEQSRLRIGDFVAVDPSLPDGTCRFCQAGRFNLCENWNATGVGRTNGACAELVAVPAANAFHFPEDIPRHYGTLVEPLACAVHGFDQVGTRMGNRYLIYGAGTMGLLLGQLARHAGAARLAMVDINPSRFELARRLCADQIVSSADELDAGPGWDVVIDATGAVAAIEDGLNRVRRGGTFLVFGVASAGATARFSPFRVYNDEITIIGSMAVLHSYERALSLLARGVVDCSAMISDRLPLERWSDAIDTFRGGSGLKIQVSPAMSGSVLDSRRDPRPSGGDH